MLACIAPSSMNSVTHKLTERPEKVKLIKCFPRMSLNFFDILPFSNVKFSKLRPAAVSSGIDEFNVKAAAYTASKVDAEKVDSVRFSYSGLIASLLRYSSRKVLVD